MIEDLRGGPVLLVRTGLREFGVAEAAQERGELRLRGLGLHEQELRLGQHAAARLEETMEVLEVIERVARVQPEHATDALGTTFVLDLPATLLIGQREERPQRLGALGREPRRGLLR